MLWAGLAQYPFLSVGASVVGTFVVDNVVSRYRAHFCNIELRSTVCLEILQKVVMLGTFHKDYAIEKTQGYKMVFSFQ